MSILNLNAPQGRGPAGKKSVKLWMGVGLLAAVLGFGSTFAASISINNNNQSEFGQGVAQTVYCGEDNLTEITVKPMSSFVNSVEIEGDEVWRQPTFDSRRFVRVGPIALAFSKSILNDETGLSTSTKGYYVTSRDDDGDDRFYVGFRAPAGDSIYDTFAPQVVSGESYGFYKYTNFKPGRFVDTTPSKFELSGVEISNIPASCSGKNFVISAYGETGTAKTFIEDGSLQVKEITAFWDGQTNTVVRVSGDRNSFDSNEMIAGEQTEDKLTIDLVLEPGRIRLNSQEVYKLVVETQEDALGSSS